MSNNGRGEGESFEAYQRRRRAEQVAAKYWANGDVVVRGNPMNRAWRRPKRAKAK
jgi:hypothetical protein